jgi:hypothetical protein
MPHRPGGRYTGILEALFAKCLYMRESAPLRNANDIQGSLTFTQLKDAMKGPLVKLKEGEDMYFEVLLGKDPVRYTPIEQDDVAKGMTEFPLELHCWKAKGKVLAEICYRTPQGLITVPDTMEVGSSEIAGLVKEAVGYSIREKSRASASYGDDIKLLERNESDELDLAA